LCGWKSTVFAHAGLFDDLVSAERKSRRDVQPERLDGLEGPLT
jgi:hypothetical protein